MLTIYKASAGSGKTYALTLSFLKLVFSHPPLFDHILAITFTNKATEEMKVRLMDYLFDIATNDNSKLISEVSALTGIEDKSLLRKKSSQILKLILYNYSGLHIQTIDSFFQQVIRRFARESGIQIGYNVEMDTGYALSQAVDMLFEDIGKDAELTQWLTDFAVQKIESGKSWNFRQETENLAFEIFSEKYGRYENDLVELLKNTELRYTFLKDINAQVHSFENTLAGLGKTALESIASVNLSIDDFSHGQSGVAGFFVNLAAKRKFEYGRRVEDALEEVTHWYSKKTAASVKSGIVEIVEQKLMNLLGQAVDLVDKGSANYLAAKEIQKNFFVLAILGDISIRLRQFRSDENKILISDVNRLLNKIIEDNDAPFIYEKTGTWLQHFLIDEFQDTSTLQWRNVLPLIKNSLSEGQDNLVVGDVKQAIYRWRNSDWNLLNSRIHDDLKQFSIRLQELDTNWRSSRKVVNFNNAVFQKCPELLQSVFDAQLAGSAGQFSESENIFTNTIPQAYAGSFQKVPAHNTKEGFVRMKFFDKMDADTGLNFKDQVLAQLPATIQSLLNDGLAQKDIAILTRTRAEAREIADVLLQVQGLRVISEESLFIDNSLAVRILLSAFQYLVDENDNINVLELQANYLVFSGEKQLQHPQLSKQNQELLSLVSECRQGAFSLYELAENLVEKLKLHAPPGEFAFLQTFLDLLLQFVQSANGEIADFLDWWHLQKNKTIQLPENMDAIRLMTIHKAKGLEFALVLVPFCNWDISPKANHTILWCNTAGQKFDSYPILPFFYKSSMKKSLFAFDYFKETLASYMDNLNLLYVAFTRAVNGLVVFTERSNSKDIKNVSSLLWHFYENLNDAEPEFAAIKQSWNPAVAEFSYGKAGKKTAIEEEGEQEVATQQKSFISSGGKHRIRINRNARDLFDKEAGDKFSFLNYGRFMHKILSEIVVKSDMDKVLNRILFEGEIGEGEKELLKKEILDILEIDRVQPWFDGSYQVMNEMPVLDITGEIKRPDRVMLSGNHAIVVDFKFGEPQQGHHKQVRGYSDLLVKMGYTTEAWLLYAGAKKIVEVKD